VAVFYILLQVGAIALMLAHFWVAALVVAGVALALAFRRPLMAWLEREEREEREARRVPPRPAQVRR
jgi:Flp pilus assembly protein TadB